MLTFILYLFAAIGAATVAAIVGLVTWAWRFAVRHDLLGGRR